MKKERDLIFDQAIHTADMLVSMFGARCEVAVHDFSNLEQSLIYISGNVTGRPIGSPITDLVLQELQKPASEIKNLANYKTVSKKGTIMKSSTVFLRDRKAEIIGALCINFDISSLLQLGGEIQDFIRFEESDQSKETFYSSVHEVIEHMIQQVLQDFNKVPGMLDMEEKIEVVRRLEEKGTFLVKGSVEYLSSVLGVSKFTIYNYLQKIRTEKEYQIREESI